ncbi:TIGR04372 family glycosyltransferase [Microcoleus sp. B7-D4]|uniref:TIGR04372 family glycosyltransferase n=1 Tax=Microcoleus sp. B7-D4 TaxID=2818696 RepID=UPI002FCFEF29
MRPNHFEQANKLKKAGKLEEAIAFYYQAIEYNPNCYLYYHNLGESLSALKRFEEATRVYTRALELNPLSASSHYHLSIALANIGHTEQAVISCLSAIELNPDRYIFYSKLADYFYNLSIKISQGLNYSFLVANRDLLSRYFNDDDKDNIVIENEEVFLERTILLTNDDFIEKVYRNYLKRDADENGKHLYLRLISNGMSRSEIVETFKSSPEFTAKLSGFTKTIYLQKAIDAYQKAMELHPHSPKLQNSLAKALNQLGQATAQQGNITKAIEVYQKAIGVDNNLAEPYYNKAQELAQQGQKDEAIENYQKAIAIKPNWAEAHAYLGNLLREQDRLEESVKHCQKAISVNPNWTYPYLVLGHTLYHQDRLVEAKDIYQKAIDIEPNNPWPYFHVASVLEEMNRLREAEACWDKMLAVAPNWIQGYYAVAYHFYAKGQQDDWIKWMQRAYNLKDKLAKLNKYDQLGVRFLTDHWTHAIGHIALIDFYLKLGFLGWRPPQQTIVLAEPHRTANSHYLNYWSPYLEIVSDPGKIDGYPDKVNILEDLPIGIINLPNGSTLRYGEAAATVQKQWETLDCKPLISLSAEDYERGWDILRSLGLPKNAWFVTLHVRTDGFHKETVSSLSQIRNADVETYSLAIESIIADGGWVIRLGDSTMKPWSPMNQVIDYAHSDQKSNWMDIFLCAACRFFLGSASGISFVSPTFGVPCVLTNWAPMSLTSFYSQDILIPKLYWSQKEKRYLNFSEFMSFPVSGLYNKKRLNNLGLELQDNTPEELMEVVVEMLNRFKGSSISTKEDELLQDKFKSIAKICQSYGNSFVGKDFLHRYANLLQ